jgi:hypothetical protein
MGLALALATAAVGGVDLDVAHGPCNVRQRRTGRALDAVISKNDVSKEIRTVGYEVDAKKEEEIEGEHKEGALTARLMLENKDEVSAEIGQTSEKSIRAS